MALVDFISLIRPAQEQGYAVPALNFCNAESAQALMEAAMAERSPALLIIGPWELPLLGLEMVVDITRALAARADVPVCLHLDHATDAAMVFACVEAGFSSVMIDASQRDFAENVRLTRLVVDYAHGRGVPVEGELGAVGRVDAAQPEGASGASLTDPDEAAEYVAQTGVDALAVSIGNAHGIYPQHPELDFARLAAIRQATGVPLVLHGGSGTPPDQLHRAIELGICKVNVASELSRAYLGAVCRNMAQTGEGGWWSHAVTEGKRALHAVAGRWMRELGSAGRVEAGRPASG